MISNLGAASAGGTPLGNAVGKIDIDVSGVRASMQTAQNLLRQFAATAPQALVPLDATFAQTQSAINAVGRELTALKNAFTAATPTEQIQAFNAVQKQYADTRAAMRDMSSQMRAGTVDVNAYRTAWDALTASTQRLSAMLPTLRGGQAQPYLDPTAMRYRNSLTQQFVSAPAPQPGQSGFIGPVQPTTTNTAAPPIDDAKLVRVNGILVDVNKNFADLVIQGRAAAQSFDQVLRGVTQTGAATQQGTDAWKLWIRYMQAAGDSGATIVAKLAQLGKSGPEVNQYVKSLGMEAQAESSAASAAQQEYSAIQQALTEKKNYKVTIDAVNKGLAEYLPYVKAARDAQNGLNQTTQQGAPSTSSLTSAWQNLSKTLKTAEAMDTRYAFRQLFRDIETGYPLIGLMINPLATVVRQLDQIVKTGGPAGAILKSLATHAANFVKGVLTIASGIILRDVIEAPFRLAANAIASAERAITSFIAKGIQLNGELGKTQDEINKQKALWDDLAIVVTKPAYDFVIGKLNEIGNSLSKNLGTGTTWQTGLMSLGSAIGNELRNALSTIYNWVNGIFSGGGPLDPTVWAENAAQLAGEFANGLINGFMSVVVPAFTAIVDMIAGMIIGASPPPLGPLRNIIVGGKNLIDSWLQGMLQADFSILDNLTGLVQSRLDAAVSAGTLTKAGEASLLSQAQDTLAGILASITTTGSATAAQMAQLHALFGDLTGDVTQYIGAVEAWRNAQAAVASAQAAYTAAQERVKDLQLAQTAQLDAQSSIIDAIQEKILDFTNQTAEIPARFTAGRKRELDLELRAAQDRKKDMDLQFKQQMNLAQAQQETARKAADAAKAQETSAQNQMRLMEQLIAAERKRDELAAKSTEKVLTLQWKPDPALTAKIQTWIDEHIVKPFSKGLGGAFGDLQYLFKGMVGGQLPDKEWKGLSEAQQKVYIEGANLKASFDNIGTAMRKLPDDIHAIAVALQPLGDLLKNLKGDWDHMDAEQRKTAIGLGLVALALPQVIELLAGLLFILKTLKDLGGIPGALNLLGKGGISGAIGEITTTAAGGGMGLLAAGAAIVGGILLGTKVAFAAMPLTNPFVEGLQNFLDKSVGSIPVIGGLARGLGGLLAVLAGGILVVWGFFTAIGSLLEAGWAELTGDVNLANQSVDDFKGAITNFVVAAELAAGGIHDNIIQPIKDAWDQIFGHSYIPDMIDGFNQFIVFLQQLPGRIVIALWNLPNAVIGALRSLLAQLPAWMNSIYVTFLNLGQGIWNSILSGLANAAKNNPISNYLKPALTSSGGGGGSSGFGGGLGTAGAGIGVPHLALGGYILQSGLAYVHAGEIVGRPQQMAGAFGNLSMTLQFQFPPGIERADQNRLKQMMTDIAHNEIAAVIEPYVHRGS